MKAEGGRTRLVRRAAALGAGIALAGAFAPLQWWPLAVASPALLMWLWQGAAPREAAILGFLFSAGTFSVGTYWLYISIHGFGQAPLWVAGLLMVGLVAIMAAYHALLGWLAARVLPGRGALRWLVGLPALWLLVEWWRGWFLSGFSWLSLGYSQTDTLLAAWAPVGGVYALSALLLAAAGALVTLVLGSGGERVAAVAVLVVPWLGAAALSRVEWTRPSGPPVDVAIVQGAIPQDMKWQDSNRDTTLALYQSLTRRALGARIVVWPESAAPDLANNLVPYITGVYREAAGRGTSVVMGVVRAAGRDYYNSVLSLSDTVGWYDKHHLVPFAEFFPVPAFVRSWMRLMSLPYSDFARGARDQPPLPVAGLRLLASICYEDAYGSSQLAVLGQSDALVNVTNDAWFGRSSARYQHFQIARMRAIEAGRYLLRAANDGVSAVIGPHGEIVAEAPEFTPAVLTARIVPRSGLAPYATTGNWPVASLALILALAAAAAGPLRRGRERAQGMLRSRSGAAAGPV